MKASKSTSTTAIAKMALDVIQGHYGKRIGDRYYEEAVTNLTKQIITRWGEAPYSPEQITYITRSLVAQALFFPLEGDYVDEA